MIASVFEAGFDGDLLGTVEDLSPDCRKDFCDSCGDCLACYGHEPCYVGGDGVGGHDWVIYADETETLDRHGIDLEELRDDG